MQRDDDEVFPIVTTADGGVSDDGLAVLMKFSTVDQGRVHLALRLADLQHLITFLLQLAAHGGSATRTTQRSECQPIPITEVRVGEREDGVGRLGVRVGGTELIFAAPAGMLSNLAHTLLRIETPAGPRHLM